MYIYIYICKYCIAARLQLWCTLPVSLSLCVMLSISLAALCRKVGPCSLSSLICVT